MSLFQKEKHVKLIFYLLIPVQRQMWTGAHPSMHWEKGRETPLIPDQFWRVVFVFIINIHVTNSFMESTIGLIAVASCDDSFIDEAT